MSSMTPPAARLPYPYRDELTVLDAPGIRIEMHLHCRVEIEIGPVDLIVGAGRKGERRREDRAE